VEEVDASAGVQNKRLSAKISDFYSMKNVGGRERTTRAIFGTTVVLIDFLATVQFEVVFLVVGMWGVLTSAFGYCPFNGLLNRNTCVIDLQPAQP
jgi:hypothetical protein